MINFSSLSWSTAVVPKSYVTEGGFCSMEKPRLY